MGKIRYYYNPVVESTDSRYIVEYFCGDGKHSVFAGRHIADSPTAALQSVREAVDKLNAPRSLWERIKQRIWWRCVLKEENTRRC
jgi:hypothetical protein